MRERNLIQAIAQKARAQVPLLKKGIGDDCAILGSAPSDDWLVTADMLVEDVHFNTSWHPPLRLGRKTLAVNISDIAAMGGDPKFALLCLALPPTCSDEWTSTFMSGFFSLLEEHRCVLIGGDTVSSEKITVSVTVIGTIDEGRALTRDGAGTGDAVYVSGCLGSAAAGLFLLQNAFGNIAPLSDSPYQKLIDQHLDPTPQVTLGRQLQQSGLVTAMQDISDGIATDLGHICTASGVGAKIFEDALPADEQLLTMCREQKLDPTLFQIKGGEDYQLLFTVRNGREAEVEQLVKASTGRFLHRIGEITTGQGVTLLTRSGTEIDIAYQGYEHLS